MSDILQEIKESLVQLEYDKVIELVKKALDQGIPPLEVIDKALSPAMKEVGDLFEKGEYFLAELVTAAEAFKECMEIMKPLLLKERKALKPLGVVVIGTVEGDLHDIGKSIVATMLESGGFEVHDLGVDVPAEKFVEKALEVNADIIAMSALLTTTMLNMKKVIDLLKEKGIRDKFKVLIGGAPITEEFAKEIGADGYAEDAVKAVEVAKKLVEELRKTK